MYGIPKETLKRMDVFQLMEYMRWVSTIDDWEQCYVDCFMEFLKKANEEMIHGISPLFSIYNIIASYSPFPMRADVDHLLEVWKVQIDCCEMVGRDVTADIELYERALMSVAIWVDCSVSELKEAIGA